MSMPDQALHIQALSFRSPKHPLPCFQTRPQSKVRFSFLNNMLQWQILKVTYNKIPIKICNAQPTSNTIRLGSHHANQCQN